MSPTDKGWACMADTCFLPAFDRWRDEWQDLAAGELNQNQVDAGKSQIDEG